MANIKNSLEDLNNYLFEQFERLADPDTVNKENIETEVMRTEKMCEVAEQILENGKLQFAYMKYREQTVGYEDTKAPALLEAKG